MAKNTKSQQGSTNVSLLRGLRDPKAADFDQYWERFVELYTPLIFHWISSMGVSHRPDVEDITQRLMCKLVLAMQEFSYDPKRSFRAWLHVATRNAVYRFWEENRHHRLRAENFDLDRLVKPEDLIERLEDEFDREIEVIARERVRETSSERDWEVFRLLVETTASPNEVAAQFGITVEHTYKIKSRLIRKLKLEIERLTGGDPPSSPSP
ncbi:MAG: DNA-directed RNA polymerase sigma-70 factor [Pirellulaceae bacterium]|nr:MAG: DNA-directed RNA polymerase sigma-70 factor [Pirellulaceae bacterium]